jgi:DNA-binding NarL/FixJ family response regulator
MGGSRADRRRSRKPPRRKAAAKEKRQIRVALVGPRAGLPSELEARLGVHPGITIVSRTSSVGQALGEAVKRAPDVVIIDAGSLWGAVRSAETTRPEVRDSPPRS